MTDTLNQTPGCAHVTLKRKNVGDIRWYACDACGQKFKAEDWDGKVKVVGHASVSEAKPATIEEGCPYPPGHCAEPAENLKPSAAHPPAAEGSATAASSSTRYETICGTCGEEHFLSRNHNHNFVARASATAVR